MKQIQSTDRLSPSRVSGQIRTTRESNNFRPAFLNQSFRYNYILWIARFHVLIEYVKDIARNV